MALSAVANDSYGRGWILACRDGSAAAGALNVDSERGEAWRDRSLGNAHDTSGTGGDGSLGDRHDTSGEASGDGSLAGAGDGTLVRV
jgi:hypothetical protein